MDQFVSQLAFCTTRGDVSPTNKFYGRFGYQDYICNNNFTNNNLTDIILFYNYILFPFLDSNILTFFL